MANENFGLGFTVSDVAIFEEAGESTTSAGVAPTASTFADIVSFPNIGPTASLFADITIFPNIGPTATLDANGICAKPSVLGADQNPANVNVLSSPGQNTLNC